MHAKKKKNSFKWNANQTVSKAPLLLNAKFTSQPALKFHYFKRFPQVDCIANYAGMMIEKCNS